MAYPISQKHREYNIIEITVNHHLVLPSEIFNNVVAVTSMAIEHKR